MTDRYHIDQSFSGGYTGRRTDLFDDAARGAGVVAGNLLGASIAGLANVTPKVHRNVQDQKMQTAIDAMESAALVEDFDQLLSLGTRVYTPLSRASIRTCLACHGMHHDGPV